ncbi:PilW family protein [Nevskia sp.]|uniref:PilW family protein n=1 Tax=Nevskia sp. TaxID=1929292 RepID=UPI0025F298BA|nr:PilW family protein [Nevskia sp.]
MNRRARQRGMSLIELMIALTLGLLLLAGIYRIFLSTSRTVQTTTALGDRQEAIRYVSARLAQDVRMAGFRGCLSDMGEVRNTLNPDPAASGGSRTAFTHSDFRYRYERYAEGFDGGASAWSPSLPSGFFATARAGTDVLTVRGPVDAEVFTIRDMATTTAELNINPVTPMPLAAGDIAMVADCGGAAIFQVSASSIGAVALPAGGTGSIGSIAHAAGSGAPGNWSADLDRAFGAGAQLYRMGAVSYFIADSALGSGPSLWRAVDGDAREIAAGIENLQVLFGEDSDGDQVADVYRRADQFADTAAWRRVAAVRVALLFSGTRDRAGLADPRSFDLLGVTVGPFSDGRLRRVVTLTLALRNRLP